MTICLVSGISDGRAGTGKNTQLAYMRDLRLLMKSLQLKADEELLQVSRQQLIAYLVRLKQEGRAASTVARKLASIKAFYRFSYGRALYPTQSCRGAGGGEQRTAFAEGAERSGGRKAFG